MKKGLSEYSEINEVLDKMLKLEQSKRKVTPFKWVLYVVGGISTIILVGTLCVVFYKSNFSLESLLSLLLAFFSIFISIFFYFKTEETSNHFHDASYNFMKDVSVTLGKIEERFGEKLNSLSDKITHLSDEKHEKTEELQTAEDERQKIINDLMDKAKLNEEQREEYVKKLSEKEKETESLKNQLMRIDMQYKRALQENSMLRHNRVVGIDSDILSSGRVLNALLGDESEPISSVSAKKRSNLGKFSIDSIAENGESLSDSLYKNGKIKLD